ncbi:MAG: hypothetical protein Q8R01_05820 [Ramlibacter sp.]|nr:hypothetical protein [Ramlibacter sp.]
MKLIPLPAFQDNNLWVLQRDGLQQEAILVTHHRPGPKYARVAEPHGIELINYSRRCAG